jgi:tRNA uridine 5-carbamoylmethylation protein Kti12
MKENALIINLFGGPSVGKSTTAAGVFSLLKLHDVDCELVTEYAKGLVWEERYKTFRDQQYLFAKQNHKLWRVHDKVQFVITDCPLMLSAVYSQRYKTGSVEFDTNVVKVTEGYNNLNILLTRTKKYNQNGRNETEDQAKEVDAAVKAILNHYNMPWLEIQGNFEGVNKVSEIVLEKLGRRLEFKFTKED